MLNLGILYESILRWVSPASRVTAVASKLIADRIDPETGKPTRVGTPDSVHVITSHEDGSVGTFRCSGVVRQGSEMCAILYGSGGTLRYDFATDSVLLAASVDSELSPTPIPASLRGHWNAEAQFIGAIRGENEITHTDFLTGTKYMQFTEAVARSSRHQQTIVLPLREFSNPSL